MTKSPKKQKAKAVEKRNEELGKKKREDILQKKRYLAANLRAEGMSMREIADILKVSIGFVCKWCRRLRSYIREKRISILTCRPMDYSKGGGIWEDIRSRSRAPKEPRRKVTQEHIDTIAEIRKGKFTKKMGAQKIKVYADMDISHQTINMILRMKGLTAPRKKRKQRHFDPFRRGHPNDLWQMDYKEFGKRIYMLSFKDDHSSFMIAADVRTTCTTDNVLEILEKAVRMFGPPRQILSDHGTQWCANNGGTARFDEWCREHGIEHIMGKVRKPTTQGKIERVRREAVRRIAKT